MDMYVLGGHDAVRGFALAGVGGQVVRTEDDLRKALDDVLSKKRVGILIITEDVASLDRFRVESLRTSRSIPLLVEIPAPEGPGPDCPSLEEMIRRATGIRI
jgi:V/A-type H+-transporting ATPase subunit F